MTTTIGLDITYKLWFSAVIVSNAVCTQGVANVMNELPVDIFFLLGDFTGLQSWSSIHIWGS